ncbi:HEAT repeat domain-containing protein [Petrimonas sp.]|uniref:HEAT repeat domain-containing protein n=1 Tax=Petrimonas sp. TaxID=2023866 RepID=UPI003F516E2D
MQTIIHTIIRDTHPYVLLFIVINISIVIASVMSFLIYHFIDYRRKKTTEKFQLLFRDLLYPIVFGSYLEAEQSLEKIKTYPVYRPCIRKVFVSELLNYQFFLSGNEREKIHQIYLSLGLHHLAIKQLSGYNIKEILWALYELSRFVISVKEDILNNLRRWRNKDIDLITRLYCIVDKKSELDCFVSCNKPINKFEQLLYFSIITRKFNFFAPHFSHWISPEYDDTFVELCTDLAAYYYQDNAVGAIHKMLDTDNKSLKKKFIRALGIFNQEESIRILMDCYEKEQSIEVKKEIIKSLGYMSYNVPEVNDFLLKVQDTESSLNLKKASMLALYRSKSESAPSSVSYRWMEKLSLAKS